MAAAGRELHAADLLVEHPQVQVEADRLHESRLLRSQDVARPSQLHVAQGDPVPRAQLGVVLQHLQSTFGLVVHRIGYHQVAVGAAMGATDPSA